MKLKLQLAIVKIKMQEAHLYAKFKGEIYMPYISARLLISLRLGVSIKETIFFKIFFLVVVGYLLKQILVVVGGIFFLFYWCGGGGLK